MGRESHAALFTFEAKRCACSLFLSNLEKEPCCHDESEIIVIEDDQSPSFSLSLSDPDYFPIATLYNIQEDQLTLSGNSKNDFFTKDFLPPPKEPIYKVLCAYTLYEEEWMS